MSYYGSDDDRPRPLTSVSRTHHRRRKSSQEENHSLSSSPSRSVERFRVRVEPTIINIYDTPIDHAPELSNDASALLRPAAVVNDSNSKSQPTEVYVRRKRAGESQQQMPVVDKASDGLSKKNLREEKLNESLARYTRESDLKFENALRRLMWNSDLSKDLYKQLVTAHREKQQRKLEIRTPPEDASRNQQEEQRIGQTDDGERSVDTDDAEEILQFLAGSTQKQQKEVSDGRRPNTVVTKLVAQAHFGANYKHKVKVPPGAASIYIAGESGYVEFRTIEGIVRHVEEWMPDENNVEDRAQLSLPRAPTPPINRKNDLQRRSDMSLRPNISSQNPLLEMLERLNRNIESMNDHAITLPERDQSKSLQGQTATAVSITYSDDEVDRSSESKGKQPLKQIAGPSKKRRPPQWKKQQKQRQALRDTQQENIPAVVV